MRYSTSKLTTLFGCPYQYWCKYKAPRAIREQEAETIARAFGIAIHDTVAKSDSTDVDELYHIFQRMFLRSLESADLIIKPKDNIPNELKRGKILLTNYLRLLPKFVGEKNLKEYFFKFKFEDFELVGKFDRVSDNKLCDWKTGKYTPKAEYLSNDLQFAIYRLGFISEFGLEPEMYYANLTNARAYKVVLSERFTSKPNEVLWLLNYAESYLDMCERMDYFPATGKYGLTIICNNCGFRHLCFK